jgi:hypothetical protein
MALRVFALPRSCARSPKAGFHWHHRCWNCGADQCGGLQGCAGYYTCVCGCEETDNILIQTDSGFDRELAASLNCPG